MGSCISEFFVNSFMYKLTLHGMERPPTWLIMHQRCLDDFFLLVCYHRSHGNPIPKFLEDHCSTGSVRTVLAACSNDGRVDHSADNDVALVPERLPHSINFLDCTISLVDPAASVFESKPYMKENSVASYTHRTSKHPRAYFTGNVVEQFHRLKRSSSSNEIYREFAKKLSYQFGLRGYSKFECYRARQRADERQVFSAFSTDVAVRGRRPAKKRTCDSFNAVAKFDPKVDWKKAKNCVSNIHNSAAKHFAPFKNQSTLLAQRQSKVVFEDVGPKLSGGFHRKNKFGY